MGLSGRRVLAWTAGLSVASGIALTALRLACAPLDDFATTRHPTEPWLLAAHRWTAPLAVVALGWVIGDHAAPNWARPEGKRSGAGTLLLCAAVLFTATILQTVDLGDARDAAVWLHAGLASSTLAAAAVHIRAGRRSSARVAP